MDNKTLSLHGSRMASIEHNRRVQGKEGKQSTINKELTDNNVTLIDIDIKEAYKQLFQDAVDDYNKTQKRSDRKIKNYYSKVRSDKKKNTHYEYIFQLGNIKNRIDDDTFVAVCADYVASFQERNPNLYLIGAYIHLDEEASAHMHLDYIPIGHYDKGMRLQASSNKAFEELTNYKSQNKRDTAQIKWQESEREYIKSFCRDYGIEVIDGDSKGKKSLSIEQYKAQKDLEQAKLEQQQAEQMIQQSQQQIDEMNNTLDGKQKQFNSIRQKLNNEYNDLVSRNEQTKVKLNKQLNVLDETEQMISDHLNTVADQVPGFDRIANRLASKINKDIDRLSQSINALDDFER